MISFNLPIGDFFGSTSSFTTLLKIINFMMLFWSGRTIFQLKKLVGNTNLILSLIKHEMLCKLATVFGQYDLHPKQYNVDLE